MRAPSSSSAADSRRRLSRESYGTTSTSVVRCAAPCRTAARPPISRYRTPWRSSTSRMSCGRNSAIARDLAPQLEPGEQTVEALVGRRRGPSLHHRPRVLVQLDDADGQVEPARAHELEEPFERREHL